MTVTADDRAIKSRWEPVPYEDPGTEKCLAFASVTCGCGARLLHASQTYSSCYLALPDRDVEGFREKIERTLREIVAEMIAEPCRTCGQERRPDAEREG